MEIVLKPENSAKCAALAKLWKCSEAEVANEAVDLAEMLATLQTMGFRVIVENDVIAERYVVSVPFPKEPKNQLFMFPLTH